MKKFFYLFTIMVATIVTINNVKADTIVDIQYGGDNPKSELWYLNNLPWMQWNVHNEQEAHTCTSREDCYNQAINYYNNSGDEYYSIEVQIYPQLNRIDLILYTFNVDDNTQIIQNVANGNNGKMCRYQYYKNSQSVEGLIATVLSCQTLNGKRNNFYMYYDSNYNFENNQSSYIFKGFYDNENTENYDNYLKAEKDKPIPKVKDLMEYDNWNDYENSQLENYTEVNLDNYEYVLLSLKNYNQTKAFQTNLQVKGQIGITPIYNYGQTSKDSITGSQVQDRCNISYNEYTSYPFYIIQSDLQNNVIYAVKECSRGSSFKFDNKIFDITYVTEENKNNPVVTIGGKTYNVIPYNDLPSTATKNEEDNYIPGQSGQANSTGGLDSAIKNVQQKMSEIWNTFTYFTDFINQIFSVFPDEVKTILLSAFTIMIVIGLIKIFIGK